ncbi:MAG TPA: hypothetical protein VEY71_05535, partial [Chitinophagales bacterium]|nr:hypothetical protein [Chitinophagales bacterium]
MPSPRFHQPVASAASNGSAVRLLLPLVVFGTPYLFVWQGLDFTDKGLMLAYADQMFRWPDAYDILSPLWLSGALAHAWINAVPLPPALAVNVLLAVLLNGLALLSFRLLRFRFESTALWCAILLSQLFIIPPLQHGYGYQALSVALLAAAALAMANGLVEKRGAWLFASGAIAGVAVFARLPNVLGIGLATAPILYAAFQKETFRVGNVLRFLTGYLTGVVTLCLILLATGHWSQYLSGIQTLLNASPQERYHNSGIAGLAAVYVRDVWRMAFAAIVAVAVSLPVLLLATYLFVNGHSRARRQLARWLIAASALLLVVEIFVWFPLVFILKDVQRLALSGLVGIAALWLALRGNDVATRVLLVCGLIASIASFAGSDVGFGAYALYPVLLPLAAWSMSQRSVIQSGFIPTFLHTALFFWWTAIVFLTLGLCATYVYRDAPRFELNYPLRNEPKLTGILTNAARRDAVDGLA